MKKTLIALLVLSIVSSVFMVRFYFESLQIYHHYVNRNTLVYLNSLKDVENLPPFSSMSSAWKVLQADFIIRFFFMIGSIVVISKLISRTKRSVNSLLMALAISLLSSVFMLLYFLASSDIYNEFVNQNILNSLIETGHSNNTFVWQSCSAEWSLTLIDFIIRSIFMVFITIVLVTRILVNEKQTVQLK